MKRNISSKAIKTMAIGLSLAMGASTAISGISGNMVVAKADTNDELSTVSAKATNVLGTDKKHTITNPKFDDQTKIKATDLVLANGMVFKVTKVDTANNTATATLVGFDKTQTPQTATANGTTTPYKGTIEAQKITVQGDTSSNPEKYTITIDKIGDGTNAIKAYELTNSSFTESEIAQDTIIDATKLNDVLGDVTSIEASAFKSTSKGDLTIDKLDFTKAKKLAKIGSEAFKNSTIGVSSTSGTTVTAIDLQRKVTIGVDEADKGAFQGAVINGNVIIGGDGNPYAEVEKNTFKGAIINGDLDISRISSTSTESLLGTDSTDNKGVTVSGTLKIANLGDSKLANVTASKLELTGDSTTNVPANAFKEFTLESDEITFPVDIKKLDDNAFDGFNGTGTGEPSKLKIKFNTENIELKNQAIENLCKNTNINAVDIYLNNTTETKVKTNFNVNAFGADNDNVTVYAKNQKVLEKFEEYNKSNPFANKKVKFINKLAPVLETVEGTEGKKLITLKFSQNITQVPTIPQTKGFTVTKGNVPNEIEKIEIDNHVKKNVKLTLKNPLEFADYTVKYEQPTDKKLASADTSTPDSKTEIAIDFKKEFKTKESMPKFKKVQFKDSKTIEIKLSKGLVKPADKEKFTILKNGADIKDSFTLEGIEKGSNTITITLKESFNIGDKIKISYNNSEIEGLKNEEKEYKPQVSVAKITGKVGQDIDEQEIKITLDETFKDVSATNEEGKTNDVTEWFNNLPKGLKANISNVQADNKAITIKISGIPTEGSLERISITVPMENITGANENMELLSPDETKYYIEEDDAPILQESTPSVSMKDGKGRFTLTMNENVTTDSTSGFSVKFENEDGNTTTERVESAICKDNKVTVIIDERIKNGSYTVSYTQQGDGTYGTGNLSDEFSNEAENFTTDSVKVYSYTELNDNRILKTSEDGTTILEVLNKPNSDINTYAQFVGDSTEITTLGDGEHIVLGINDDDIKDLNVKTTATTVSMANPAMLLTKSAAKKDFRNLKTVNKNAFNGNKDITKVELSQVDTIKEGAFANTEKLEEIKLPKATKIEKNAFSGATLLKNAEIGTNAEKTEFDIYAFSNAGQKGQILTLKTNDKEETIKSLTKAAAENKTITALNANNKPIKDDNGKAIVGSNDTTSESDQEVPDTGKIPEKTPENKPEDESENESESESGSYGGHGAIIGNASDKETAKEDEKIEESSSDEEISNETVSKELSLEAISLPSVSGESKGFSDVSSTFWAADNIEKLSKAGVINGMANGDFAPNGQTKRADVTIMISKLLGLNSSSYNSFDDVDPNAYYAKYVAAAKEYGIVNGSNGKFNPEGTISREDTMVMMGQILKGLELNVDTSQAKLEMFSDSNSIAGYAREYVAILVNNGIISGNNDKINPKQNVTRAEMATIMSNLYDKINEAKIATETITE